MDFRPTEEQELMVQAIEDAMNRENLETYFQDCDKEKPWAKAGLPSKNRGINLSICSLVPFSSRASAFTWSQKR